jgi:putative modified peptide
VSRNAVERTLGKLATDEQFRVRFFENPAAAMWEAGIPLSPLEVEALAGLSSAAIARFSESLDGRIRRLCLIETPPGAARKKRHPSTERFAAGADDAP